MIRLLIKIIFILLFLLIIGLFFLVTTNKGLQGMNKAMEHFVPGLRIQNISGNLLTEFSLQDVHYQNKKFSLTIAKINLQWNAWQLLQGTIDVKNLTSHHITLILFKQETNSSEKFQIKLPANINLENVIATDFQLYRSNGIAKIPLVIPAKAEMTVPDAAAISRDDGISSADDVTTSIGLPAKAVSVIPAKAVIQTEHKTSWFPASAGITTTDDLTKPIDIHYLQFSLQGREQNQQLQAHLNVKKLTGVINHSALNGHFNLFIAGDNFTLPQAEISIGNAMLRAQGYLNQNWQIVWQLNIPNINALLPNSSGLLQTQGNIQGARSTPIIKSNILARHLQLTLNKNNIQAKNLAGNLQADLTKEGIINLSLIGHDLAYNKFIVSQLMLHANGKTEQHNINLQLQNNTTQIMLDLTGGFKQDHWQGKINTLTVLSQAFGNWQANTNTSLQISKNQLQLSPICFSSIEQKLCSQLDWRYSQNLRVSLQGENFNLEKLATLFMAKNNKTLSLSGKINFQGNIDLIPSKKIQANLNTTLSPGKINLQYKDSLHALAFTGGIIDFQLNQNGLLGKANINFVQQQNLIAQFLLPNFNSLIIAPQPNQRGKKAITPTISDSRKDLLAKNNKESFAQQPIQGTISFQIRDISWLQALTTDLKNIRGLINLNLKIAGTIAKPIMSGQIKLANGYTDIPSIGISLKNISLTGSGDPKSILNWEGSALAGSNWLHINGQTDLLKPSFPTQLLLHGENLLIANTNEYKIFASPNIQLNYNNNAIAITGTVNIPTATLMSQTVNSSSVTLPDDVVFIDRSAKPKTKSSTKFSSQLHIILGNNVKLDSNGATGRLTGTFLLNYDPQNTTTASGEINIIDGKYEAYGQKLKIRTGKIIFNGGPINNPNLNIEATRTVSTNTQTTSSASLGTGFLTPTDYSHPGQVLAGIRITGPLHDYHVDLFSQPAIYNQTDILSLLVLGTTSTQISAASGQLLLSAASQINLGGGQVSNITNQLQNLFGLDQLDITSESEYNPATKSILETPSLSVGKAIGKNIFINYSIGLFNPISIVRLRYNLNHNWSIQTDASSLGQGIDLFYQVETK
jgi:translocation and assembly module TamB